MSVRRKPVPYSAVEGDRHVLFILEGPQLTSTVDTLAFSDGHGIEMGLSCGTMIRLGNVHPRLAQAARSKTVLVATLSPLGATIIGDENAILVPTAEDWFPESFYLFLDPVPTSAFAMAEQPFARFLEMLGLRVILMSPGGPEEGPPIALCARARPPVALPAGRRWNEVRPGILAEGTLLAMATEGYPANDDIAASVTGALDPSAPIPNPRYRAHSSRNQVAICFSAREAA